MRVCAWREGNSSGGGLFLKILFGHFYITIYKIVWMRFLNGCISAGHALVNVLARRVHRRKVGFYAQGRWLPGRGLGVQLRGAGSPRRRGVCGAPKRP